VRRIKTTLYIPLIPTFSLKGEGVGTCVDTYALRLNNNINQLLRHHYHLFDRLAINKAFDKLIIQRIASISSLVAAIDTFILLRNLPLTCNTNSKLSCSKAAVSTSGHDALTTAC